MSRPFVRGRALGTSTQRPLVVPDDPKGEWYTPPEVFERLGLEFDLDPASPPGGVPWIPTKRTYTRHEDGLLQPWEGVVFLNPPYKHGQVMPWMRRMADHGQGIALVMSQTEASWYQEALGAASAVCLVAGRITFRTPWGARKLRLSSTLFAYGEICALALEKAELGWTTRLRPALF